MQAALRGTVPVSWLGQEMLLQVHGFEKWTACGWRLGRAGREVGTGDKNKCAFLGQVRGQVRVPEGARGWWDGDSGRRGSSDSVSSPPSPTPVWPGSVLIVSVD